MRRYSLFVIGLSLTAITVFPILASTRLSAENTIFRQSIVPLQCYIDAINAGNGSHILITPEDCIVDPLPPTTEPLVPPVAPGEAVTVTVTNTTPDQTNFATTSPNQPSVAIVPNKSNTTTESNATPQPSIVDNVKENPVISILIISFILLVVWSLIRFYDIKHAKDETPD